MCAAVQNTGGSGEGDIDLNNNFEEWLQSQKAPQSLITKMKTFGMDSIEMLKEINGNDEQEMKSLAQEMGLSTIERIKFQVIVKNIPRPRDKLNSIIYPEERKAILEMEQKLKQIEQSMTNIDDAKKDVENEVERCTKLITTTYDDIVNKVIARKEAVLTRLKEISNDKLIDLNKVYEEMKANSVITTSHIDNCYEAVNKKTDLTAIDQRKEKILKVAQTVDKMDIIDKDNPLIKNCNIDFNCNAEQIIDVINKSGHFISVPVPILLSVESVFGKVKLKWKLDETDEEKRNEVNKLKVEWSNTEIKDQEDEKYDDIKADWNFNKTIDVNNINNDSNEMEVGVLNKGDYLLRLQCMINDKVSKCSNIKSVSIKILMVPAQFIFTNVYGATISDNGTRVKSSGACNWAWSTSSTGWNSGKYSWKIKCNARMDHNADGVGVTSECDFGIDYKQLHASDNTAFCCMMNSCIYIGSQKVKAIERWKEGDIITINLDCDSWKIAFHLNDTDLGIYDLPPNQTYHPALTMCGCDGYDLQLIQ